MVSLLRLVPEDDGAGFQGFGQVDEALVVGAAEAQTEIFAGSRNVFELHGSTLRNYCQSCGKFYDADYILHSDGVPHCTCGGLIKPDVVLYEEGLDQRTLRGAIEAIGAADVLIVGGTSLTVYPAAGLIDYYTGDKLVLINRDATPYDGQANLIFRDKIGEVLSAI